MAYLGNAPARSFISFERQVFTIVNSQTAYTLSHSVTNENDLRLVINNIVQEPGSGKAYTASGTTLTLSAALTNGTDEMYCVFLGRATATNAPAAGSVNTAAIAADAVTTAKITDLNVTTAKIAADAITEAKIADDAVESEHLNDNVISGQTELASAPASTDELLISDAGTLKRIDVSLVGGDNTPFFHAYMNANQSISSATTTTLTFDTERWDTASGLDTSAYTYTIPTGEGGYWVMIMKILFSGAWTSRQAGYFNVNGSDRAGLQVHHETTDNGFLLVSNMNLSAGDVIKTTMYQDSGSTRTALGSGTFSEFSGFKLIG